MAQFEFKLPDIGEGVAEGEIVQWFVKEGENVREDAPLVSVLTDKANVEIPSPKGGKVVKLHARVGEKVKVGGLLVTIETAGASGPAAAIGPPPATPSAAPGSPVAPSPAAAPAAPAAPPTPASQSPAPAPSILGGRVLASPYLRRLAQERGIDLAAVKGSGPGGRIVEADLSSPPSVPAAPSTASAAPVRPSPAGGGEAIQRIAIRGLRRTISERMARSVHTAAHFTYVEEVDVTELVRFRERMARHLEPQGIKLSYLPFIVKGVIAGLRAHPWLNATMDDAANELVVHSTYNIGIAAAAPDGLIVPVVRHAETKSIAQLAREIQTLAERGKQGKLSREELIGSTFTITSLGALGGVLATPILNYPEVAILGVHKIVKRPIYRGDGTLAPAELMNLSVSLDHRVIDGIVGAQFLSVVKSYLEDPHQLFAELS